MGEYIEYGRPARTTNLDHLARFLVNLGCPFLVRQPPELLDAIQRLGEQIAAMGKMQPDLPRAL